MFILRQFKFACGLVSSCLGTLLKRGMIGKTGGRIEVTGRRRTRRQQLQDGLRKTRGYCKLKKEVLDRVCGELGLEGAMYLS
jgi:hypothetical protein